MKPSIVAAAVFLAGVGQAFAADFPVPAPGAPTPPASYTPVLPPYTNWSGLYIGLNGGYDFGTANWNSTGNFSTSGGIIGGTIGLNFPYGPVIFGFEGDIDWADANGSTSVAQCATAGGFAGSVCQIKISTIGTARARLGYSFDRALVFVSAGGAFGFVRGGDNPPAMYDSGFALGWAAGAGVEFALVENWTVKAEYLFLDLGNVTCSTAAHCGVAGAGAEIALTESIVRAGVNYKFSW